MAQCLATVEVLSRPHRALAPPLVADQHSVAENTLQGFAWRPECDHAKGPSMFSPCSCGDLTPRGMCGFLSSTATIDACSSGPLASWRLWCASLGTMGTTALSTLLTHPATTASRCMWPFRFIFDTIVRVDEAPAHRAPRRGRCRRERRTNTDRYGRRRVEGTLGTASSRISGMFGLVVAAVMLTVATVLSSCN